MRSLSFLLPEVLPEQIIEDIKTMALKFPEEIGVVGGKIGESTKQEKDIRRSQIRWIDPRTEDTAKLTNLCTNLFVDINREHFGLDIERIFNIQYTEYLAANRGFYHKHIDSLVGRGEMYDRKLSMTIQLSDSDEYEGGDFEFDNDILPDSFDKNIIREKGRVLIFPSFLPHKVNPVTKGIRKSLVTWIEGPAWR
tara:strand:- start:12059 stop:12643 length:585 start_codon:yes stop_codon:yes gene_type:complete